MSDELVTIASFPQAIQAHIARSRLEADGIEAFIRDENIVTMNWLYSNAVGGVKLQVHVDDAKRASEILQQAEPDYRIDPAKDPDTIPCPYCGSTDIRKKPKTRPIAMLMTLLFLFPFFRYRTQRTCGKCGRALT